MRAELIAAPVVLPDGWQIQLTNANGDDFVNCRTAIVATRPDGRSRRWTLPDRLILRRPDVISAAVEELCAEVDELP